MAKIRLLDSSVGGRRRREKAGEEEQCMRCLAKTKHRRWSEMCKKEQKEVDEKSEHKAGPNLLFLLFSCSGATLVRRHSDIVIFVLLYNKQFKPFCCVCFTNLSSAQVNPNFVKLNWKIFNSYKQIFCLKHNEIPHITMATLSYHGYRHHKKDTAFNRLFEKYNFGFSVLFDSLKMAIQKISLYTMKRG